MAAAPGHEPQRGGPARGPDSTLHFTRDLIALRKQLADLRSGAYAELPSPPKAWAWRRGEGTVVAINLGEAATEIEGVEGSIELGTRRGREGEPVEGTLRLAPAEGVVALRGPV